MKLGTMYGTILFLALAACGGPDKADLASENANTESNAADRAPAARQQAEPATNEAAAAANVTEAAPGPAVAGAAPTRAFLIGTWGEAGDCSLPITFKADGTMIGPVDRWEYADGKLTMVGLPDPIHLKVIDDKTLESRVAGAQPPHKLTRCQAPS